MHKQSVYCLALVNANQTLRVSETQLQFLQTLQAKSVNNSSLTLHCYIVTSLKKELRMLSTLESFKENSSSSNHNDIFYQVLNPRKCRANAKY